MDDLLGDETGYAPKGPSSSNPHGDRDRMMNQLLDNSFKMLDMMGNMRSDIGGLQDQMASMNDRISRLEETQASQFREFHDLI